MNRKWKPIDVGGLRLYQVYLDWKYKGEQHSHRESYIVAATAPRHAAKLIEDIYKESYEGNECIAYWYVTGHALNVLQPADWWDKGVPCIVCDTRDTISRIFRWHKPKRL